MFRRLFGRPSTSALRLCVLGNSHVGALKLAWEDLAPANRDVEITFFTSPGRSTRKVKLSGSLIVPTDEELSKNFEHSSRGKKSINPADYDVFLCYGTYGWKPLVQAPLSASFSREIIEERLQRVMLTKHLELLRKTTKAPIFTAPAPLLISAYKDRGNLVRPISEQRGMLQRQHEEDFQAVLAWQPDETLVDDGTATRDSFSVGSSGQDWVKGGDVYHDDDDISHMNKAYGVIWLNAFLPRLAKLRS